MFVCLSANSIYLINHNVCRIEIKITLINRGYNCNYNNPCLDTIIQNNKSRSHVNVRCKWGLTNVSYFHIYICPSMTFNLTLLFDLKYEFPLQLLPISVPLMWTSKHLAGENTYICMPIKREGLSTQLNSLWSAWVLPSIPPVFLLFFLFFTLIPPTCFYLFPCISLIVASPNSHFPIYHFTTLFPILLSFSALHLCLQSIPSTTPLSPLLSVSPLIQYELLS